MTNQTRAILAVLVLAMLMPGCRRQREAQPGPVATDKPSADAPVRARPGGDAPDANRVTRDEAGGDSSLDDRSGDNRAIKDPAGDNRAIENPAGDSRATDDRAIADRVTDDRAADDSNNDTTGVDHSAEGDGATDGATDGKMDEPSVTTREAGLPRQSVDSQEAYHRERVLMLAPGGPLVLQLNFAIPGSSPAETMQPLVEEALAAADRDGDSISTWQEVFDHPRFQYGGFGNMQVLRPPQQRQVLQIFDTNQDERMDRDEAFRFLTNDTANGRVVNVRGSNNYRDIQRQKSVIRLLLDTDEDGQLSTAEIREVARRLASRDSDDDAIVVWEELAPRDFSNRSRNRGNRAGTGPAISLGPTRNLDRMLFALKEQYAFGGLLDRASLPLRPELFTELDANNDGMISRLEMERFDQVRADLIIQIDFSSHEEGPALKLVSSAVNAVATAQRERDQQAYLKFDLADGQLEFFVTDAADVDYEEQAQSILEQFDQNGNGYLDNDELLDANNPLMAPFDAVDMNGDQMAVLAELVLYLQTRQAATRNQIHVSARYSEDALFSALDIDSDLRITEREMRGAADRLLAMDQNNDGSLSLHEFPASLIIMIGRGPEATIPSRPQPPPKIVGEAPRWYLRMDSNQDGDLSRQEFLGETETFDRLDLNGDGLVELGEVGAGEENQDSRP